MGHELQCVFLPSSAMKSAVAASVFVLASADWEAYKAKYGLSFNGDEEDAFKQTYTRNMEWAAENSNDDVQFGENQFAHLTQEQYRVAAGLGYKASALKSLPHLGVHEYQGEELAASVDWTTQGAVTPVKDQGSCGGCWSFAATGALEGATKVAGNSLVSLSEQQFLDCDKTDSGCGGGLEYQGWDFFKNKNQGICTETSYPYKARNGNCAY